MLRSLSSLLAGSVLATVATAQSTAVISGRTPVPFLTLQQEGGRLLAWLPRQALETDFMVTSQVDAVDAARSEALIGGAIVRTPAVGERGRSGALRWRQRGDSLVLLEYAGATNGHSQYRRRTAVPILRREGDSTLLVSTDAVLSAVHPVETGPRTRSTGAFWGDGQLVQTTPLVTAPSAVEATVISQETEARVSRRLNVLKLPVDPMRPRLYDPRLTYYAVRSPGGPSFGAGAAPVLYIARRRLEKKDPKAEVSDVVKPIVFRIDTTVPPKWVPYIRQGLEDWNPVFAEAGFRHALVVKLPGDPSIDGTESVVGWSPNPEENAQADFDPDPRTGEIVRSSIVFFNGITTLMQRVYFAYSGAADPRARFPYPDSLTGKLLRMVITHEIGHSLGLEHNFKAGSMYPTDSLRSPKFVHRMGHTPSLMAYSYFNYVAQPEDHVAYDDLHARIGPYDRWAIAWGYRPIPDAKTPEDERPTLERWRAAQDTAPYLRATIPQFSNNGIDPGDQMDVMGDDAVKTAEYGIRNLARLAAIVQAGKYDAKVGSNTPRQELAWRWAVFLSHVADLVGGRTPKAPYAADPTTSTMVPIDSVHQVQALRTVIAHVLEGHDDLVSKHVLARVGGGERPSPVLFDSLAPEWAGDADLWRRYQRHLFTTVAQNDRFARVAAQDSTHGTHVLPALCGELMPVKKLLTDAQAGTGVNTPGQDQLRTLQQALAGVTDPTRGACREWVKP